ncbi:DUF6894 family protein [Microvirga soli]|uniref:DUF6894 family protein n=1 Tax=Microvirga soli TaxID=1854496 RepID=UPI00191F0076|nr:hypothetical protein [Microvirga soli]
MSSAVWMLSKGDTREITSDELGGINSERDIAVAHYYLDIHDGEQLVRDDEGFEFDSPGAAMRAAARSAPEIRTSRLVKAIPAMSSSR